jgi:hypothetical protein
MRDRQCLLAAEAQQFICLPEICAAQLTAMRVKQVNQRG